MRQPALDGGSELCDRRRFSGRHQARVERHWHATTKSWTDLSATSLMSGRRRQHTGCCTRSATAYGGDTARRPTMPHWRGGFTWWTGDGADLLLAAYAMVRRRGCVCGRAPAAGTSSGSIVPRCCRRRSWATASMEAPPPPSTGRSVDPLAATPYWPGAHVGSGRLDDRCAGSRPAGGVGHAHAADAPAPRPDFAAGLVRPRAAPASHCAVAGAHGLDGSRARALCQGAGADRGGSGHRGRAYGRGPSSHAFDPSAPRSVPCGRVVGSLLLPRVQGRRCTIKNTPRTLSQASRWPCPQG